MLAAPSPDTSSSAAGAALYLDHISHRYGASLAVDNVSLKVGGGELVALLGPSGCGKTTLLRIIAGFLQPDMGQVLVDGVSIDPLPPHKRTVGIVFQNYALFPHMTVADNVAYGLAARGLSKAEQTKRVGEMLDLVQLSAMAGRYPRQLSGGQQQRIALARALAVRPSILLLDEPFAALDKNLRLDMQIEIKRIQRMAGTTTLLVTHDQEEALSMADKVAVLSAGKLEQFAAPTEIYDRPATYFVNTFVGSCNVLTGTLRGTDNGLATADIGAGQTLTGRLAGEGLTPGAALKVCIRPEHLRSGESGPLAGTVDMGLPLGASVVHEIRLAGGQAVKIAEPRAAGAEPRPAGAPVSLTPVSPEAVVFYPA